MYTIEPDIDKHIYNMSDQRLNRIHISFIGPPKYIYCSWYALMSKTFLEVEYGSLRYTSDIDMLMVVI